MSSSTSWLLNRGFSCSLLAALPAALGDGVGAERRGRGLGLRQGALPVGARHAAALAQIRLLLEAPQAGRPSPLQGKRTSRKESTSGSHRSFFVCLWNWIEFVVICVCLFL